MKKAVSRKKEACKAICQNSTEEKNRSYESMMNKAISKTMREKAEEAMTKLQNCPNGMFSLVK